MTPVDHVRRYFQLRLGRCEARPELHEHQIATLRALSSPSTASTPGWWELSRAELLDRYANQQRLYRLLGEDRLHGVAGVFLEAIEPAASPPALARALNAAVARTSPVYLRVGSCHDALRSLVLVLLEWATEGDAVAREWHLDKLRAFWRVLQHNDPGCSWERICSYPPYRNCLPFDDAGLDLLGSWLRQATGTMLVDLPPVDAEPAVEELAAPATGEVPTPTLQQVAQVYRDMYERASQDPAQRAIAAVCEQVFALEQDADGVAGFLCKLLEHDIDGALARASLAMIAGEALAHCAGLSQPHIEAHYRLATAALARARTPTEIAHEMLRSDECFSVESTWNLILMKYALLPVLAAMRYDLGPTDANRETVRRSYRVSRQLFGEWDDVPRFWSFFCQMLLPQARAIRHRPGDGSAHRGEIGWDLLQGVREWILAQVMAHLEEHGLEGQPMDVAIDRLVGQRFATPEAVRDRVTSRFRLATGGEEFAAGQAGGGVIYWGRNVLLGELESALSSPPRPC